MIVLCEICEKCNRICDAIYFRNKFIDWTSGNGNIDKFIQGTQLSSHDNLKEVLEWIPYDRLYNIKYVAGEKLGEVYKANWIDGYISFWDNKNLNWKRKDHNMVVTLKKLNSLGNILIRFKNEVLFKDELFKNELFKEWLFKNEVFKNEVFKNELLKNELFKNELFKIKNKLFKNEPFKIENEVLFKNELFKNELFKNEPFKNELFFELFKNKVFKNELFKNDLFKNKLFKNELFSNKVF
jgi:hypothetical protein